MLPLLSGQAMLARLGMTPPGAGNDNRTKDGSMAAVKHGASVACALQISARFLCLHSLVLPFTTRVFRLTG